MNAEIHEKMKQVTDTEFDRALTQASDHVEVFHQPG